MPQVQVTYRVPVIVIVDTDEETVSRVVVLDEEVELTDEAVTERDAVTLVDAETASRAREIAESGDWTAWEHGF